MDEFESIKKKINGTTSYREERRGGEMGSLENEKGREAKRNQKNGGFEI